MNKIERHPWPPFAPDGARILFLGSFPPPAVRWSMEFYYPNFGNDFWRILGIIFFDEKEHFVEKAAKKFREEDIKQFLTEKGIAIYDTALEVRRLKDNASDKTLEVVTPTDIPSLLSAIPQCTAIVTTGQKATGIIVETFGCKEPPIGQFSEVEIGDKAMRFWRMPSSSRAYPLSIEKKAAYYRNITEKEHIM